jgi:hypothetical protein
MKKAKNKIEFEELLKDLFEKLKEKSVDLIEDIDFDKVWDLIEKRIAEIGGRWRVLPEEKSFYKYFMGQSEEEAVVSRLSGNSDAGATDI